jgi:primosomal protein N' (replication factor Y)
VAHDQESPKRCGRAARGHLPPFAHLAMLVAEAAVRDAVGVFRGAKACRAWRARTRCSVPMARAGLEREHAGERIERSEMQRFLPHWREAIAALPGRRVRWALDVDPLGFA